MLTTAPSALWLAWILHNLGKEPAFEITDFMKSLQMDKQGQKLVAPEGHSQVTETLQSQDGSGKSELKRGKQRTASVILDHLFQVLPVVYCDWEKPNSCIILGS